MTNDTKHPTRSVLTVGGGKPIVAPTAHQVHQVQQSRGLGDTVHRVIDTATFGLVPECNGCKRRRATLNRAFPYRRRRA